MSHLYLMPLCTAGIVLSTYVTFISYTFVYCCNMSAQSTPSSYSIITTLTMNLFAQMHTWNKNLQLESLIDLLLTLGTFISYTIMYGYFVIFQIWFRACVQSVRRLSKLFLSLITMTNEYTEPFHLGHMCVVHVPRLSRQILIFKPWKKSTHNCSLEIGIIAIECGNCN